MQTQFIDTVIDYDGSQLRSHWVYERTGELGDILVTFVGASDVTVERLVDLEDARHERPIMSRSMLHFIGEFYNIDLPQTILLQRLLISIIQQGIYERMGPHGMAASLSHGVYLRRTGNDLYEGDKKLTVSIATVSQVSTLLHAGVNISSEGTPVPTKGLDDYGIEPIGFAQAIMKAFKVEYESMSRDISKVRPVL